MKVKNIISIIVIFISSFKLFSQTNQPEAIINCSASYSNNLSYNAGEVYVIFDVLNYQVVSKPSDITSETIEIENNLEDTFIYPNPVTNILNIKTTNNNDINSVILYSMDGREILNKKITKNQIDLSNLPIGTYILKTDLLDSQTFKLIKQ